MNAVQHTAKAAVANHCVIHLLLPEGKAGMMPKNSEEVMEQIRLRATFIGPVLEGILHEPHAYSHAEFEG